MGRVDARVDHVRARAGTSRVVVDVGRRTAGAVRKARDSPGRVGLRDIRVDLEDGLLLDVFDLRDS